jgi:hypothetical protein
MSKCVTGSISKDFPLYHSTIIPTYESPDKHNYIHKRAKYRDIFTNEHPDIFRLEGMKEGGYVNPFLDKVIKVDRSEYLKKLSTDRKNVNFIDFLKSNRKYSQDPKLIRYISSDANTELKHKRMGKTNISTDIGENNGINSNSRISSNRNTLLTESNSNTNRKKYHSLLRKLNSFLPKIDYRIKRTLIIDNKGDNSINSSNLSIDLENDSLYKKIATGIDSKSNNNLRNINDFEFEPLNKNVKKNDEDFQFKRKQIYQYNPIKDKMETIVPPPYKNPRWSSFLENYFLMMNSRKQFQRKGGLLSEFSNKNIGSINNNKFDIQQRLKKEKEEKEKSIERKKSISSK